VRVTVTANVRKLFAGGMAFLFGQTVPVVLGSSQPSVRGKISTNEANSPGGLISCRSHPS
jgi:hypothetical protein